jgi:hypothetical protein
MTIVQNRIHPFVRAFMNHDHFCVNDDQINSKVNHHAAALKKHLIARFALNSILLQTLQFQTNNQQ